MIGTEQERDALERILAVLKPILTDHNPPIAIDWVGKGAIAVGQEFESAINAVREHKDDATIRAMLAPDDVVVRERIETAYANYDSDDRVNGPEDFDAFSDAVSKALPTKAEIQDAIQGAIKFWHVWSKDDDEEVYCSDCNVGSATDAVLAVLRNGGDTR